MRINSIGYVPYSNSLNKREVNNNSYNPLYTSKFTPSFGEVKCVPGDELLLSYDDWRANPKALLKVVKSQKDNKDASKIFGVLLDLRSDELRRIKTEPYDGSKFRTYGKAAKLLSKMPSFDPNYETWECYLVNDSLTNCDDELALVLMRHKKYDSFRSYISDENKVKFNYFLYEPRHIFF